MSFESGGDPPIRTFSSPYRIRRNGFRRGDRLRYDLAYRYRLWPRRFGNRLLHLNSLLELNDQRRDGDQQDGIPFALPF